MKYCIKTKYLGPTNTKGARIKAFCLWGSVVVSYDYAARNPHWEAVVALFAKLWRPEGLRMVAAEEMAGPDGGTLYVLELGRELPKHRPQGPDMGERSEGRSVVGIGGLAA